MSHFIHGPQFNTCMQAGKGPKDEAVKILDTVSLTPKDMEARNKVTDRDYRGGYGGHLGVTL